MKSKYMRRWTNDSGKDQEVIRGENYAYLMGIRGLYGAISNLLVAGIVNFQDVSSNPSLTVKKILRPPLRDLRIHPHTASPSYFFCPPLSVPGTHRW